MCMTQTHTGIPTVTVTMMRVPVHLSDEQNSLLMEQTSKWLNTTLNVVFRNIQYDSECDMAGTLNYRYS